ncbi:MAG: hypothetical protein RL322_2517 [Pseudomonadota bacterium]|jgi:putative endonuclease
MVRSPTQQDGDRAEDQALAYLLASGLRLIDRQAQRRVGEIDLIMAQGDTLVFVEVRRRSSTLFGGAAASITPAKQRRVRQAAQSWLQQHYGDRWPNCRFDVCALDGDRIEWIPGAF